jgi:hypothetical protein
LFALITPQPAPLRYLALLIAGVAIGAALVAWLGMPLWGASVLVLTLLAWPTARTWRTVAARFGMPFMVVSVLLYLQGFHTIEHIVQFLQLHLLAWPPRQATGLLSGLNVEIVHFVWNWSVLLVAVYLLRSGLRSGPRNLWGVLFLAWALAHTLEHTYLMYQYLAAVRVLLATGGSLAFAEGLPGVLGRSGWLAANQDTSAIAGLICQLVPANLVTPRLDIHFWWNVGETTLLLAVAIGAVRRIGSNQLATTHEDAGPSADGAVGDQGSTSGR